MDKFSDIKTVMMEVARKEELEEDEMDEDDQHGKPLFLLLRAGAFKCLGRAWSTHDSKHQSGYFVLSSLLLDMSITHNVLLGLVDNAPEMVDLLGKFSGDIGTVWNIKLAALDATEIFVAKCQESDVKKDVLNANATKTLLRGLLHACEDQKYVTIRENATGIIKKLVDSTTGESRRDKKPNHRYLSN
jgi:hypothetical protein